MRNLRNTGSQTNSILVFASTIKCTCLKDAPYYFASEARFAYHNINLEEIDFVINENHNTKIELTNSVGVIMKYPSVNGLNDIEIEAEDEMQQSINLILACIESVYDDKAEYDFRDYTLQERNDFIENLTQQQLASIQEFFTTMPTLQYELDFKCSVCGTEDIIPITGLQNFFS